jgi:hypothetical protein
MAPHPQETPAHIAWEDERVVVTHAAFRAVLDPVARRGTLCRTMTGSAALQIALKVALCCRLPLCGGVPVHGAGIVVADGSAGVFFGPSGAGKSTLAALAEGAVLSDELVAVRETASGFVVRTTGFWGTLDCDGAPAESVPLRGLFELKQEKETRLARVPAPMMMRKLLGVTIVPPAPPLWSAAARVLGRVSAAVPGFELGWARETPPWNAVRVALAGPPA